MHRPVRRVASLTIVATAIGAHVLHAPAAAGEPIDFARDVQPILKAGCLACHNGVKRAGGLAVLQRADVLAAADSGLPPVVPGRPGQSELLRRITSNDAGERMPADGEPLPEREIEIIRRWIADGAAWPVHWAFRAVERPAVPAAGGERWSRSPLDRFVGAGLRAADIEPSPEADRSTLIRRLHLDLVGLPPAPEDVDAFVEEASPAAYEKVVDRLLASPRFGERWGRHWLDAARYADTDGYEVDAARPNAWHWRDWVIGAVNSDLPFDRFTIEQLAGDLLPEATSDEHLATAFHRQTLTNKEGGADQEEYRVEAVIDRVNTTATVWLGLTTACAQCHDHPYEPVSQREFYGLFAFFNNADESELRLPTDADDEYQRRKAEHEQALATLRDRLASAAGEERAGLERQIRERERRAPRDPAIRLDVMAERAEPRTTHVFDRGSFLQPIREEAVPPGGIEVLGPLEPRHESGRADRADRLDLARWLIEEPLTARVAVNHVVKHLFGRGLVWPPDDFGLNGEPPTHPELLEWLAAEFSGGNGSRSHSGDDRRPRTADHGQTWSRKRLIRLIVTSATYRQSSRHRPELAEIDPQNQLLHRQSRFRVEAEIVRDLHLAASGLLADKIGGPSVFPPFPADLVQIDFRSDLVWNTSTGLDRYRRGMYTFFKRTLPHPDLVTFDCPQADATAVARARSNTPLQALLTLNNEVFVEAAAALGARTLRDAPSGDDERLAFAFRLALARPPSDWERSRLLALLAEHRAWYAAHADAARELATPAACGQLDPAEAAAWTATANVLLNLDEFITRE